MRLVRVGAWARSVGPSRLAALAVGVLGFGFAVRSLALGITLSSPVPSYDGWAVVDLLRRLRAGQYGVLDLFEQHNEHRIVTARLHFLLDYALFHLGALSVVVATYAIFGLMAAVLAGIATRGRSWPARFAAVGLALAAIWSAAGWINLVWSFQIQWAYVHLAAVLAVAAFCAATARRGVARWAWFAGACLADALAVGSMSSGLVTVVPVLAVAIWRRAPVSLLAGFVAWHGVLALLFFHDYDLPPQRLVAAPAEVLRYLAPLLGACFPGSKAAAIDVGGLGIAAAVVILVRVTWLALVRRRPVEGAEAVLLGAAVFALAEGLVTAFGRAGMPNPTQLALRYGTPGEVFWTGLGFFAWRRLSGRGSRAGAAATAAAAVCAVAASNLTGGTVAAWRTWSAFNDNEGFNIVNGVMADERGQRIEPMSDVLAERLALLRDLQLGPFAENAGWFRAPLNSLGGRTPASLPACAGAVTDYSAIDDAAFHVQGWAVKAGVPVSSAWALAFGPDGRMLGYARTWQKREDAARVSGRAVVLGYDFWFRPPPGEAGRPVTLAAVFPGGTVPPCRVDLPPRPRPLPPADPAPE